MTQLYSHYEPLYACGRIAGILDTCYCDVQVYDEALLDLWLRANPCDPARPHGIEYRVRRASRSRLLPPGHRYHYDRRTHSALGKGYEDG